MMVLEIELPHAESTHPRADSNSRIFAAIPDRTVVGPVLQVHIFQKFLALLELETIETVFRTITSANQLSIYGADRCEQFGLTEAEKGQEKLKESVTKDVFSCAKSQEVKLVVSLPKLASGNSLQENIHDFESLDEIIQFTRVCELALFKHTVSAGRKYKTRPDEDDGSGKFFYAYNTDFLEHTHNPDLLQQSLEEQLLDQSWKFKILKILEKYGLAIAIPSPLDRARTSYVVISRESLRDEIPNAGTQTKCGITH